MLNTQRVATQVEAAALPPIPGIWCFTDGYWKENDLFTGQGWYSTLQGVDGLMGARNVRASVSPFHAEVEALLWANGMCEEFTSFSDHFCNGSFSIGEAVFITRRIDSFYKLFGRY